MVLADIQKKSAEERKREKRLVHLTNALSRDFFESKRLKANVQKAEAEYLTKSMLDYLFFQEKKELKELNEHHIQDFMLVHAPRRLNLTANTGNIVPEILNSFLSFLDETGHINNGEQLRSTVQATKRAFLKLMPKAKQDTKAAKKPAAKKPRRTRTAKKTTTEVKVGRNDPCPCGSGKKYKKCCGKSD
jgi:preprotein translocase subunit SecA